MTVQRPASGRIEATTDRYDVTAVSRAAQVLALFGPDRRAAGLDDLAAETGVPKATLRGILDTLAAHDLLAFDAASGAYRLGYAWLRYGDIRRRQFDLRAAALPMMRRMRDALDETAILSLRVGDRRVHLDYVESRQAIRRVAQIGHEGPLHVGAAGLVLLAGLDDAAIDGYLARERDADAGAVRRAVAAIRRDGHAVADGTVDPGTAAVAAAVRDHTGAAVATLTVSCPRDRFDAALRRACIAQATATAAELSRQLGGAP